MFHRRFPVARLSKRFCSSATTENVSAKTSSGGSSFVERIAACLVGMAIGYSVNFYMVLEACLPNPFL